MLGVIYNSKKIIIEKTQVLAEKWSFFVLGGSKSFTFEWQPFHLHEINCDKFRGN